MHLTPDAEKGRHMPSGLDLGALQSALESQPEAETQYPGGLCLLFVVLNRIRHLN